MSKAKASPEKFQATMQAFLAGRTPLFNTITELEAPILELKNRARIMVGVTDGIENDDGMAVYQIAGDVEAAATRLSEIHRQLFRMAHPIPEIRAEGKLAKKGIAPKTADADLTQPIGAMPNRDG